MCFVYVGYLSDVKRSIAREFNVSVASVCYHLNGQDYKKIWNDKVKARIKSKQDDIVFQEKRKEADKKSKKRKRLLLPEFNKYVIELNKSWYSKNDENRQKWREYSRKYRLKKCATTLK